MKLILATLACLVLFVQGTTVDVKEAKMDQKVIQQMLTPLLTKYSIHGPLAYTEDGLREVLDSIQTKIIKEFRNVEKFYDGRVKEECGNRTLNHFDKMNDVFGDLPKPQVKPTKPVTKDTVCAKGEEGDDCRKYKAYLKEQNRRRQIKEKIYSKKVAERKHKTDLLIKAEAKIANMKGMTTSKVLTELKKEYVTADGMLQQAEDAVEMIEKKSISNKKWAKAVLLQQVLSYSKTLGSMNSLASLLDDLDPRTKVNL
jgi:hypothetical protein